MLWTALLVTLCGCDGGKPISWEVGDTCPEGSEMANAARFYADADDDLYGDPQTGTVACDRPVGYASDASDCDDSDPTVHPGAVELCDGVDQNCNWTADEAGAADETTWYYDNDGDGWGDSSTTRRACEAPGEAWVDAGGDCNDNSAIVSPGEVEVCDDWDNDCDGTIDEPDAIDASSWWPDLDQDGYGAGTATVSCDDIDDCVNVGGDCDDADPLIHPDAVERCGDYDYDCDGFTNEVPAGDSEECPSTTCLDLLALRPDATDGTYWLDPDGDGAGVIEAWCDMTTDGGGYTVYKVDFGTEEGRSAYAYDAESYCAAIGLKLFVPRTEDHLVATWAVATDATVGPSGTDDYLYIMGIYPKTNGALCYRTALNSGNALCHWWAPDGHDWWVSDRVDINEPSGDNDTRCSMYYDFDAAGAVSAYNDVSYPGYSSRTFICDAGDKY